MRLVTCAVLLTLAAGIAEACSAFIPFDEYAGPPLVTTDPGPDGGASDGGTLADAGCTGVDLRSDPNNCQACARRCGSCDAGRCPIGVVADGTSAITAVSLGVRETDGGGEALYFVRASGTLGRIDPDGSHYEESPATVAAPVSFGSTNGVVASKTDAIEAFSRDRFVDAGVFQVIPPRNNLGPLLYAANVFWSDDDGMFWSNTKADASVNQLSDASAIAITSASGFSYWTDETGMVLRTSSGSPDFSNLVLPADAVGGVNGIAVGPKHIYLTQRSQGLRIIDYDDGTPAKLARLVSIADPELVAVDDSHVYVYNAGPAVGHKQLLRYELDGTGFLILADSLTAVRALIVDATYLYFTDQTKLLRIVK